MSGCSGERREPETACREGGELQVRCPDVVLDFDLERQKARRKERLVALPMGTRPSNPQQNAHLGAPFAYDPALDADEATNRADTKAKIHADLTKRGYFVVSALRHGFDFVVYEGDPVRHHGSYFVAITDEAISARQLVLWHRLAASAHKSVLLGHLKSDDTVGYWTISGEER
ncbi:Probable tRNA-splicing endonuclease subunit tsp-4 (tRNA-intron endonuclease sen34) (tRNA-splicing protein 2) [Durusdinium trenchii]|uniref:tRNA-intron lyase n=1 Tax=Durusdinium trenchii TaxID=1381693 RepID=A0ABP0QK53_9DINO